MPCASANVPRHLARGVLGLLAFAGAFAGIAIVGPVSLLLLAVAAAAWRGCPTCWAIGLVQTRERACRTGG